MPISVHTISGIIEPIIPPTIRGDKLERYIIRAMVLAISPIDPMVIAAYDANFFLSSMIILFIDIILHYYIMLQPMSIS
ncbi:hypothetical protein [Wolbachia endosymbiont (group A) of Ennomos erosarius]|uniref:hypothetical protein n=1 Tax=Wolbachia endosymbiont (group A) of Ennomos erosarius TaxID=3066174 RepID=UPI003340C071